MPTMYLSHFALSDSSAWTTITVNLRGAPLSRILRRLYDVLAASGKDPISVKIVSRSNNEAGLGLPEDILLNSVLRMFVAEMALRRLKSLVVHTELRSSLQQVSAMLDEEARGKLQRLTLRYNVDDTTLAYPE